jgi:hypothetical protein
MEDFVPVFFTEIPVAQALGLPFYEYPLTDSVAAMVDRDSMRVILSTFNGNAIPSDVQDMHIGLHNKYLEIDILESLTTGETKASQEYKDVMDTMLSREEIVRILDAHAPAGEETVEEEVVEEEVVEEEVVEDSGLAEMYGDFIPSNNLNYCTIMNNGKRIFSCEETAFDLDLDISTDMAIIFGEPLEDIPEDLFVIRHFPSLSCDAKINSVGYMNEDGVVKSWVQCGDYILVDAPLSFMPRIYLDYEAGCSSDVTINEVVRAKLEREGYIYAITESGYHVVADYSTLSLNELSVLAENIKKNIVADGVNINLEGETIYFSNRSGARREVQTYVFGQMVGLVYNIPTDNNYDLIIRDTVTNVVVACFEKNNMEIYNMVRGFGEAVSYRLTGNRTYEELRAFDSKLYEGSLAFSAKEYTTEFSKSFMKGINKKKEELERLEKEYLEYMNKCMVISREMRNLEFELHNVDEDKMNRDLEERAKFEFDEILNIDKVSHVSIGNGYINVSTHNIYVKHDVTGKWYDIGTFLIRVNISRETYDTEFTRIWNTKYDVHAYEAGMNAPHVFRNANLCHGNLTAGISGSYRDGDIYGVVFQLILFLSSANQDDVAGRALDSWPEVSEEEALSGLNDAEHVYKVKESTEIDNILMDALSVI